MYFSENIPLCRAAPGVDARQQLHNPITLIMKTRLLASIIALAGAGSLSAQNITNGSFEYDNAGGNLYMGWTAGTKVIANGSSASYLPGWSIDRPDNWQYDRDGDGPASAETKGVTIYNGNAENGNPYGSYRTASVANGPFTGDNPFDAIDGDYYLGFYNDFAPADMTSATTASTTVTGLTQGETYQINFYYAAFSETNAGTTDISLTAKINGVEVFDQDVLKFTNDPGATGGSTGVWKGDNGAWNEVVFTNWKKGTFSFTATDAQASLDFIGLLQGGPAQLVLDGVKVSQVPEPSACLLLGMSAMAVLFRRRRAA